MAAKPLLLVVDDEPAVLERIGDDLRRRYGERHRIVTAGGGEAALDVLRGALRRGWPVALLLADQRMPGMEGVDFLVAARDLVPDARRALLTAYADTAAAIRAINEADLDYYLQKPWDPPEERLYPVVDDLLAAWRPPPELAEVRVVSHRWSRAAHELREFLGRHLVSYRNLDVESEEAQRLLDAAGMDDSALPVVFLREGDVLVRPTKGELADRIGLSTRPALDTYDLVVVGAGPAGLAAGVYGASEGLRTLIVESDAPGGQAGTSSLIRNYLGFPTGVAGADLADKAQRQARSFAAEISTPQEAIGLELRDGYPVVSLADGSRVASRAVILATGVGYRQLDVPGAEELRGAGVYYIASHLEAESCRDGAAFVIGGGNSAGQAAVFLAGVAKTVTVLIRGDSLADTMSRYLIDALEERENVTIRYRTQVTAVQGGDHIEQVVLAGPEGEETLPAAGVFVFIGMKPRTTWLPAEVHRDPAGFLLTGVQAHAPGWPLDRPPFPLETSMPGVFAAGDARLGSIKRVASAVGEGSTAVRFVHEHLAAT